MKITLFLYGSVFQLLLILTLTLHARPPPLPLLISRSTRRDETSGTLSTTLIFVGQNPDPLAAGGVANVRCPRLETPFQLPLVGSLAVSEGERARVAALSGGLGAFWLFVLPYDSMAFFPSTD